MIFRATLTFAVILSSLYSYAQTSVLIKRIEGSGNMARTLDFKDGVRDSLFLNDQNRIFHPIYDFNDGPIRVEVLDPSLLPNAEIRVSLDSVSSSSGWKMYAVGGIDTIFSSSTIGVGDEQLVPQWGLLVQVKQVTNWEGECDFLLNSSMEQSSDPWVRFFGDVDNVTYENWIRSGTLAGIDQPEELDYFGDPNECFESILNGTWAPWKYTSHQDSMASPSWDKFKSLNDIDNQHSVDIVITPDQTKWSRCPVLEIADYGAIGDAERFNLRMSPSVNKNGNPDGSGTMGMSWFPGYAVNLETGERLNMAFGENSWLQSDQGGDMVWNPTTSIETSFGEPLLGGGHYIYVFGRNGDDPNDDVPMYDEGQFIYNKLSENNYNPGDPSKRRVYKDAMWVGIPILEEGHSILESDVVVKIRVRKPYVNYQGLDNVENGTSPLYSFLTSELGTSVREELGFSAFSIYPNPTTDQFQIVSTSNQKIEEIRIYNLMSQLVYTNSAIQTSGSPIAVDTSTLPTGTYFVVAQTTDGLEGVKRLVVR